jgi:predicted MPP superfamily phosphohydrolase
MQLGFKTGKFQWSPASFLYPAWNGVYGLDNNYLYVNRGLGTISLPSRIGMPPEITVITLVSEN